jgi:hypothetical protein
MQPEQNDPTEVAEGFTAAGGRFNPWRGTRREMSNPFLRRLYGVFDPAADLKSKIAFYRDWYNPEASNEYLYSLHRKAQRRIDASVRLVRKRSIDLAQQLTKGSPESRPWSTRSLLTPREEQKLYDAKIDHEALQAVLESNATRAVSGLQRPTNWRITVGSEPMQPKLLAAGPIITPAPPDTSGVISDWQPTILEREPGWPPSVVCPQNAPSGALRDQLTGQPITEGAAAGIRNQALQENIDGRPGNNCESLRLDEVFSITGEFYGIADAVSTANAMADEPVAAVEPPSEEILFVKRAAWFQARLDERKWTVRKLEEKGGPDHRTAKKVLRGEDVQERVLESIACGLSKYKKLPPVVKWEIPRD